MCICSTYRFLWICSPEFLINPWPFIVSSLWDSLSVFEFSESLSLLYISFFVSLFLFDWKEHHMLFSSSVCWVHFCMILQCPSLGKQWHNCIISVLPFMANSPVTVFTTLSLSISLWEGTLSFCALAIVSSKAVSVGVHGSFEWWIWGDISPGADVRYCG